MPIASHGYRTEQVHFLPSSVDISDAIVENLHMTADEKSLENRIRKIKKQIGALGDIRPGALSQQYNVCGNPSCRCKATPPIKHGPYYQISFTWKGKSTSQFVRDDDVSEARQQLENYHRLRELIEQWVTLSLDLFRLRAHKRQDNLAKNKSKPKTLGSKRKRA